MTVLSPEGRDPPRSVLIHRRLASNNKIILVEKDGDTAQQISDALASQGLSVVKLRSAELLLETRISVSAILMSRCLDNNGNDSVRVLKEMRTNGDRTPVIIISSLTSIEERVRCLNAGADDFIDRPFAMVELLARVEAVRRRHDMIRSTRLTSGPLTVDRITRLVTLDGELLELLPREFELLEFLMLHEGMVVSHQLLLKKVWKAGSRTKTNTINVSIGTLRKKIGAAHNGFIWNVRGQGFRFGCSSPNPQLISDKRS